MFMSEIGLNFNLPDYKLLKVLLSDFFLWQFLKHTEKSRLLLSCQKHIAKSTLPQPLFDLEVLKAKLLLKIWRLWVFSVLLTLFVMNSWLIHQLISFLFELYKWRNHRFWFFLLVSAWQTLLLAAIFCLFYQ